MDGWTWKYEIRQIYGGLLGSGGEAVSNYNLQIWATAQQSLHFISSESAVWTDVRVGLATGLFCPEIDRYHHPPHSN